MKKYTALMKVSMQNVIAYRFNYVITLVSGIIYLLSVFFLWKTIYAHNNQIFGYSWADMKAYLMITFLINSLISWYAESRLSMKILDGSVAMELVKPINYQKARLTETFGISIFECWFAIIMIAVLIIPLQGVSLPRSIDHFLLFLFSLVFSFLIKFNIIYMAGLLCFWTTSSLGIAWARIAITNLLSGALIPISFFPFWLKTLAQYLPFQGIVNVPVTIYLEKVSLETAIGTLLIQIFWIVVLWLLSGLLWKKAIRQLTIHGG
jgi:ABC-2 type transport system permease protein